MIGDGGTRERRLPKQAMKVEKPMSRGGAPDCNGGREKGEMRLKEGDRSDDVPVGVESRAGITSKNS